MEYENCAAIEEEVCFRALHVATRLGWQQSFPGAILAWLVGAWICCVGSSVVYLLTLRIFLSVTSRNSHQLPS